MSTSNTAASKGSNYIDLHMSGLGYLSRVREVPVRKGPPFLSVSIRAMFGEKGVKDGVSYTPLDAKAVSEQSQTVLRLIEEDANNRNKRVMVQFKVGDVYIDTFTYKSGEKAGMPGVVLKARLLLIHRAWVKSLADGDDQQGWHLVYELPKQAMPVDEDADQSTGTNG